MRTVSPTNVPTGKCADENGQHGPQELESEMHNPRYDGSAAANDSGKVEVSPTSKRDKENDGECD